MDINWYGQACFRLRGRGVAVVTDPYNPELGNPLPRLSASIVTVSHHDESEVLVKGLRGGPYVISGPGEYEVGGTFVFGVATSGGEGSPLARDAGKRNTAYVIEIEDVTVCHLGYLDHPLNQEQVEQLNDIDVLLLPVGGRSVLTGGKAAEVVGLLEPKMVVPMLYKVPGMKVNLETTRRFLNEMGAEAPAPVETLSVTKGKLSVGSTPSAETQIVILEPSR